MSVAGSRPIVLSPPAPPFVQAQGGAGGDRAALLDDDAYHSAVAVVDDFLESVLETGLAVLCHLADFCLNAVFDNLFYGFPKNIGIPDAVFFLFGVFLWSAASTVVRFMASTKCSNCG